MFGINVFAFGVHKQAATRTKQPCQKCAPQDLQPLARVCSFLSNIGMYQKLHAHAKNHLKDACSLRAEQHTARSMPYMHSLCLPATAACKMQPCFAPIPLPSDLKCCKSSLNPNKTLLTVHCPEGPDRAALR